MKYLNSLLHYGIIFLMSFLISFYCFKCSAQDTTPQVTTETSDNIFVNRTLEQEDPVPDFTLQIGGEERLYTLSQGQPAPVSGTLFNAAATAWLQSQIELWKHSYIVHLNTQLNTVRARARLEIGTLTLNLNTERETSRIAIAARDRQITELTSQVRTLTDSHTSHHRINFRRRILLSTTAVFIFTAVASSYITYRFTN